MDLAQLIASLQAQRAAAEKRRSDAKAELEAIAMRVKAEGRNLTDEESARSVALIAERDADQAKITKADVDIAAAQRAQDEEDKATAADQTRNAGADKPAYDKVARVGAEARTYRPDNDRRGKQFLTDVAHQFLFRSREAEERLSRHMLEERAERGQQIARAAGTGAFTGLVVPQYLTDLYAPATAALRPFADVCNHHDLPEEGMTVNISRITTATSVALQATENTAVSETNIDDTLLTENVQTAAGQQTISRQAIERGTGIDDVVMQDLFKRYATTLDSTLINQATTGLSAVAQAVAYTDATPTAAELWPKLLNANANVEAALLAQAIPSHVIMHSRRWYWLQSQVGTSWPFMSQPGIATQAGGTNYAVGYASGIRGILPNGNLVVVDNNIGTTLGAGTEDEIYVVPRDECHLWEDPDAPVFIRADQPAVASLGVLFVLYGYFAYSFRRYTNGMGKVNGTGLIAPVF